MKFYCMFLLILCVILNAEFQIPTQSYIHLRHLRTFANEVHSVTKFSNCQSGFALISVKRFENIELFDDRPED